MYRFDPATDAEIHFDSFDVPVKPNWTVMDVLDYISECALRVNGKVKLACSTEIAEENMLEITLMNSNVLRDLVVIQ